MPVNAGGFIGGRGPQTGGSPRHRDGPLYARLFTRNRENIMQVDLFLVWVALLGAVSFIALSFAD
jgi:hypothetical protein